MRFGIHIPRGRRRRTTQERTPPQASGQEQAVQERERIRTYIRLMLR